MTGKYIQGSDGRFRGSIGDGKGNLPTAGRDAQGVAQPEKGDDTQEAGEFGLRGESRSREMVSFDRTPAATVILADDQFHREVVDVLTHLENAVPGPWVLIGGMMVYLHCREHGVTMVRPTGDVDIGVNVFAQRDALAKLTHELKGMEFSDISPDPLKHGAEHKSYRWERDGFKVDVVVPDRVNHQKEPPRAATGKSTVEFSGVQGAERRGELVRLQVDGYENEGRVRRPNLLGAVSIKAEAAQSDNRERERHHEDLVYLGACLARSPALAKFVAQSSAKDRRRVRKALDAIPNGLWRKAPDPEASKSGLELIAQY